MNNKRFYWCAMLALILLVLPMTAWAADNPVGVAYRGHIQDLGDYPSDGSWVDSPTIIGTTGQSKRIEGFEIKLTGAIPEGMELRYNVHVQNKGWLCDENDFSTWPKDGDYAGTRGESLRIEAVKIVLTDTERKAFPGYDVAYRGHVQNIGNLPVEDNQWLSDGDQLGMVGSSLRLEALQVTVVKKETDLTDYNTLLTAIGKIAETDYMASSWEALQKALSDNAVTVDNSQIEVNKATAAIHKAHDELEKKAAPVVYDSSGTYGPETGTQVINGDVIVKADGIKLRILQINGDLYIGEEPVAQKAKEIAAATISEDQSTQETSGSITTELENLYIAYFTRMAEGTGVSISGSPSQAFAFLLTSGSQFTAITPNEDTGMGAPMQITAGAGGVSVSGIIGSLDLMSPGNQITLLSDCLVQLFTIQMDALNCGVITSQTALIQNLLLQGAGAAFTGPGPIQRADIQANGASFATRPDTFTVASGVTIPPTMPAPSNPGGGYTPPATVAVSAVTVSPASLVLAYQQIAALEATILPTNATNKAISWTSSDETVATVDATGTVIGINTGTATITATANDGGIFSACDVTVKPTQAIVTFTIASGAVPLGTVITMQSGDADAIYYTTDGSDPSTDISATNTTKAMGESVTMTFTQATTIKAIAVRAGYFNSVVTSVSYTLPPSADLQNIELSPATSNFVFSPTTYDYPNVTVANDVEEINLTVTGSDEITMNNELLVNGTSTIPVCFMEETTITIVTEEANKAPKTYTIKVTPSSGAVSPQVTKKISAFTATNTVLDLNTSGIFGIKPGNSGVLSNVVFTSNDATIIDSGGSPDGQIAILKDGSTTLEFISASVTLVGTTYNNISLNNATITITSIAYLTKVNTGTATVGDYDKAGITEVVAGNLVGINQAVIAARNAAPADLSKAAIQQIVADYLAGANSFTVVLENSNTKIQTEAFNLSITGAKDSDGNILRGAQTISVNSDSPQSVTFADGSATMPISLDAIGDTTLSITIDGINAPQTLSVTVYSKLSYDSDDSGKVSGYDAVTYGSVVAIPPDNQGIAITQIGARTFYLNTLLTTVTIPGSVTTIGDYAFSHCTNLTTVNFSTDCQLTSIGIDGFSDCPLTSINLPDQLMTIGDFAFYHNKFETLTIPASVTSIGELAFYAWEGSATTLTIESGGSSLTIDEGAFKNQPLTTITLPNNVIILGPLSKTMGSYNSHIFITAYNSGGAGTYTYNTSTSTWTKSS